MRKLIISLILANALIVAIKKVNSQAPPDTINTISHENLDSSCNAQFRNKRNMISLNIGGPTYGASIAYSRFTSPSFNTEIGLGLIGFYGGIKYHNWLKIGKEEIISPYIGLIYTNSSVLWPDTSDVLILSTPTAGIYMPAGLHFIGGDGFSIAAELAKVWLLDRKPFYYVGLKIGYLF